MKDVILKVDAQQMVAKEPTSPSQVKLRDARAYFATQLSDKTEDELQELVNKVLNGLKFTRFQVDTDVEGGLIFEVTNNRGRPLNDLDKIKNYLMYIAYKASDPPLATAINDAWAEVLRNLFGSHRLREEEDILRYHWVMRTGVAKEYDVHRRLKERLRPPFSTGHLDELRDYVGTLKEASYVIRELSNPEAGFAGWTASQVDAIAEHVNGLHRLRVFATFYPLVVASRITLRSDPVMFRRIVAACEAFAMRVYKIANRRADTGLTMFANQARYMFSMRGKTAGDIQTACERILETIRNYVDTYGNDATVRSVLSQQSITDALEAYEIRHVLGELERWKCRIAKEKPLGWAELEKATLEHIWPQQPIGRAAWTSEKWSQHWRIVNCLGNLTLTFWNPDLSNKEFRIKKRKYSESNLRIQRELREKRSWQESQVVRRRNEIIDFVLARWQVPTV